MFVGGRMMCVGDIDVDVWMRQRSIHMRGWWGISGMCEWMSIQVIEKHRRTVMKVILVGRMGKKDDK